MVDLLFASSGVEREVVASAEALEVLPGLNVRVAGLAELIALKLLSRDDATRPQDLGDLLALAAQATAEDFESARTLVHLIEERNYNRGRDLSAELERLQVGKSGTELEACGGGRKSSPPGVASRIFQPARPSDIRSGIRPLSMSP